jgi:hypothetical protein
MERATGSLNAESKADTSRLDALVFTPTKKVAIIYALALPGGGSNRLVLTCSNS